MTFWVGVSLGFGVGGCILFLLVMFMLSKVMGEKGETNKKLYHYWEVSMDKQKEQVEVLTDIAMVLTGKDAAKNEDESTDF